MPDIYVAPHDKKEPPAQSPQPEAPQPSIPEEPNKNPHTKNPFAAFSIYPDSVRFETQEEQEEIVLLLRRHIITNFFWVLTSLALIIGGPFTLPLLRSAFPFAIPLDLQIILMIIWYTVTGSFIFMNFLSWYYNVYIVTNERIVDVDFYNLTYKQISSASLEKIQDVTIKSGGVVRTIFDFADVFIQTAGTEDNFNFEAVPKPDLVARQILELTEKYHGSI